MCKSVYKRHNSTINVQTNRNIVRKRRQLRVQTHICMYTRTVVASDRHGPNVPDHLHHLGGVRALSHHVAQ